jgi:hypothetical protein
LKIQAKNAARMNMRRERQRGSELIEFSLVLIPLLGFTFLLMNIAWTVFEKATLGHATREGVRYAVTSQTKPGLGHKDSIKAVVRANALFLLRDSDGWDSIHVRFYTPDTLTEVSDSVGGNSGGNLVEVSVEGFNKGSLMPSFQNLSPIVLSANSWDRMEATPPTGAPPL